MTAYSRHLANGAEPRVPCAVPHAPMDGGACPPAAPSVATTAASAASAFPKPKRVLLVLAGLIGDSVMSTLVEARRLWPQAHLVLLGQKAQL